MDLWTLQDVKHFKEVASGEFKQAEKAIEKSAMAAIRVMEKSGDTGKFVRKQKAG